MTEKQRRRRERLRVELVDEGVDLGVAADDPLYEILLDEIDHARQPPVHEQRRNPYGVMVFSDEFFENRDLGHPTLGDGWRHVGRFAKRLDLDESPETDIAFLRRMCNGRSTFLVRSPRRPATLFHLILPPDELRLSVVLRPAIVVQRTSAGAIKIFAPSRVITFDEEEWSAKPYARDVLPKLHQMLTADVPIPVIGQAPYVVLDHLLSFCLHVLSARHIGATFVWRPTGEVLWELSPHIANVGNVPPVRVGFTAYLREPEMLATFLSVADGACLVGANGQIRRVEAKLTCSDEANRLVQQEGGTRHTSAKRYSYDDPDSIVFVVTHDGPVTIYARGERVMRLQDEPL